jgi:hypothetical protein
LKDKLAKHPVIGPHLAFSLVEPGHGTFSFFLVHSSSINVSEAVNNAYQLASKYPVKDVDLALNVSILNAYQQLENEHIAWPPDPHDLVVQDGVIPHLLQCFLTIVLSDTRKCKTMHAKHYYSP